MPSRGHWDRCWCSLLGAHCSMLIAWSPLFGPPLSHFFTRVVLVDAVSSAISSSLSTLRRKRTVPALGSSISTTFFSLAVASSLPVSAAS